MLRAGSVADDLSYVALTDLAGVLADSDRYRIIGGHMVTALVTRWALGASLYRETGDTDLGAPPIVLKDLNIVGRLQALGYEHLAGVVSNFTLKALKVFVLLVPSYPTPKKV